MPGFTHIDGMTEGEAMIRRIQAGFPKTERLTFPTAPSGTKCDRQCRECSTVFYDTRRTHCPHCDSHSVWPIVKGVAK